METQSHIHTHRDTHTYIDAYIYTYMDIYHVVMYIRAHTPEPV